MLKSKINSDPSLLGRFLAGATLLGAICSSTHLLPVHAAETATRNYQAQWIWCTATNSNPFQFARFWTTFDLSEPPNKATAYVAADTFYRLWLNGRVVMHGPARASRGTAFVDPVDVGTWLISGTNTLMVEVFYGICPFETLAQAPGLLCEVEAERDGKLVLLTASGASWKCAEIDAWSRASLKFNFQRGWLEQFDARLTLGEIMRAPIVIGGAGSPPWQRVEPRDVPMPAPLKEVIPGALLAVQRGDGSHEYYHGPHKNIEPKEVWDKRSEWLQALQTEPLKTDPSAVENPEGLTARGNGTARLIGAGASVTCDLNRGYVGFVGFEVEGRAGDVIDVVWGDRLARDGTLRPCVQTGRNALRYTLREGRQSFLSFNPQFARYLRAVYRGKSAVTIHRLNFTEFRFPDHPGGDFTCSDDDLNQVYQTARWTTALNTLDAYMDCPHRERNAMYGVEGYWMQKAVYPFFGDTSVSRRCLMHGADGIRDPDKTRIPVPLVPVAYPMHISYYNTLIPTQPVFWVLHAGVYERCSGDLALIRTLLPDLQNNLDSFGQWRNSDGLLESITSWMFFDYADILTDGVSVAFNSAYVKALTELARLEHALGATASAEAHTALACRMRDALNRFCAGGLFYPDAVIRDEQKRLSPSPQASETTQYFVVWSGIPPPDRMRDMWQALRDDFAPTPLKRVQPIRGLSRAGLYPFPQRLEIAGKLGDHAALIRDAKAMFLPMAQTPPNTLWEDPMAGIALCHSIGCGVGGILTEEVLGIRFGQPLLIAPNSGGALTWCKGYITMPKGKINVSWISQRDQYHIQVSIPSGNSAHIILPPEAKTVWSAAKAKSPWRESVQFTNRVTLTVRPGNIESQF